MEGQQIHLREYHVTSHKAVKGFKWSGASSSNRGPWLLQFQDRREHTCMWSCAGQLRRRKTAFPNVRAKGGQTSQI